jgi:hypothetical protein
MSREVFYSGTTGWFYERDLHGADIPVDAVEITREEYVTLISGQAEGKEIAADSSGRPVLTDPIQVSAALSLRAQLALTKSDITILRCYEASVAVPTAWATYRTELRAIVSGTSAATELPLQPDYPAGT